MSIILVSGDKITKHQLNNSPAKQSFSFPKANRFLKHKSKKYPHSLLNNDKIQFYLVVINSVMTFQVLTLNFLVALEIPLNMILLNSNLLALHQTNILSKAYFMIQRRQEDSQYLVA